MEKIVSDVKTRSIKLKTIFTKKLRSLNVFHIIILKVILIFIRVWIFIWGNTNHGFLYGIETAQTVGLKVRE